MRIITNAVTPIAIACYSLLGGFATVPPAGTPESCAGLPTLHPPPGRRDPLAVRYQPEKATFFVHNEIEIDAPPQAVWILDPRRVLAQLVRGRAT